MPNSALFLLGVVHGGADDLPLRLPGTHLIAAGNLAALTRRAASDATEWWETEQVRAHNRLLETAMQHVAVVPMPPGIALPGAGEVERFLHTQRGTLEAALALLDGTWEFRLHVRPVAGSGEPEWTPDLFTRLYGDLRRLSRAAVPIPTAVAPHFSAAFLVPRERASDIAGRVDEFSARSPMLRTQLTGPWPPYDFVRVRPEE